MISFSCSACGKKLKVKPELAGKKVKCPHCSQAVSVPASSESLAGALTDPGTRPRPDPGEDRTVPPRPAASPDADARTLPPSNPSSPSWPAVASSSDTIGQPAPASQDTGLTDFLAPAQQPDEIGRLGPYRVLKVLGHGGMGVVFKAEDPGLLRLVALKAMLPAVAANPTAKERFFREARAAAALKHPHIVTIFQVGEDRGAPFLAMEFLEGEPLDERIKREGKIPVAEVVRIGREVALGLACAHEKGLIHRDIKPANVWLEGKQGHAKILDFGLARALADDTHLTQSGAIIGTPAFMAPEQAGGEKVDHRADLFSLGSMMYRMCTGELPFQGNSTLAILSALAMATPAEPAKVNALVPEGLSDLVMRLLAKKPEFRPASAQEVADALAEMASEQTAVLARPKTVTRKAAPVPRKPAPPAAGKGRRWWPAAAVAALVLAAVAAGVWWGMRPGGGTPSGREGSRRRAGPNRPRRPGRSGRRRTSCRGWWRDRRRSTACAAGRSRRWA